MSFRLQFPAYTISENVFFLAFLLVKQCNVLKVGYAIQIQHTNFGQIQLTSCHGMLAVCSVCVLKKKIRCFPFSQHQALKMGNKQSWPHNIIPAFDLCIR